MDTNELEIKKLEELTEIRKELQNIRAILEYTYVPKHKRIRTTDKDGKSIRIFQPLEDPLAQIRKECNINW